MTRHEWTPRCPLPLVRPLPALYNPPTGLQAHWGLPVPPLSTRLGDGGNPSFNPTHPGTQCAPKSESALPSLADDPRRSSLAVWRTAGLRLKRMMGVDHTACSRSKRNRQADLLVLLDEEKEGQLKQKDRVVKYQAAKNQALQKARAGIKYDQSAGREGELKAGDELREQSLRTAFRLTCSFSRLLQQGRTYCDRCQ